MLAVVRWLVTYVRVHLRRYARLATTASCRLSLRNSAATATSTCAFSKYRHITLQSADLNNDFIPSPAKLLSSLVQQLTLPLFLPASDTPSAPEVNFTPWHELASCFGVLLKAKRVCISSSST